MFSKLKPMYVIIPGAILPLIVICVFLFVLLPPVDKQIGDVTKQRDSRKQKAEQKQQAEQQLRLAKENLAKQTAKLDQYMRTRSIALSTYQPVQAMIALWFEYQEDLKPVVEAFIDQSGCQLVGGDSLPAPEMKKPTLGQSNFLTVKTLNLRVRGTMAELKKLYSSLKTFKRVGTINLLQLTPMAGEELEATVPLTIYILAEGPEAAAAPAAPAGAPGGMPGAAGAPGPGGAAATPGPSKAGAAKKGGGEEEGGGLPKIRRGEGGGGEDA